MLQESGLADIAVPRARVELSRPRQGATGGLWNRSPGFDGLGMLVNQGVIGIKYWTGRDVDPTVMQAKLFAIFGT
jgi:hypothetical protein